MNKCILLVRISTAAQDLASQSEKVRDQALRDGYTEDNIYQVEDVESGSKLSEEERQGLTKLKRIIETDPDVDRVYAYEISRISRRAAVVFSIRDYLISRGINLTILAPSFNLLNPDGTLSETSNIFFGIFSTMSENENAIRLSRVMRGKEKKKAEGKLSSGYPIFGYSVDSEKRIIPHPQHAQIVREIFERYSNLESSGSIAKDLYYRNAIPTKSNKLISMHTHVCVILKEGRYCKKDPNSIYPALISKELFNKVQQIRGGKPDYFTRKSKTKEVYPLQGFLFTEDNYILSPSISNNRYLKMRCFGTNAPISLNMKAVHVLSLIIMNQYVASGALEVDRLKKRDELNKELSQNKAKLSGINTKISSLQQEIDRINVRIIKGRISETKGDALIDDNTMAIHELEEVRQSLLYDNTVIKNKLIYLANPIFNDEEIIKATNNEELKELVNRYLRKAIVKKIGHSKYMLSYFFVDGTKKQAGFYSHPYGVICFDEQLQEISTHKWKKE